MYWARGGYKFIGGCVFRWVPRCVFGLLGVGYIIS